jgi:hypothetical protein
VVLPASNGQGIRGHNPFLSLTTERQKNLGQKNAALGICTPFSRTTIFLPFDFSAFSLVAAEGHAG